MEGGILVVKQKDFERSYCYDIDGVRALQDFAYYRACISVRQLKYDYCLIRSSSVTGS